MIQDSIVEDFEHTVAKGKDLSAVLGDGTDNAFHSLFQRGIFDDVPVFGLFVKGCNVFSDIQTYRLCKKIYKYLFLTQDYDRVKMDAFWYEYTTANKENGYEMMLSVLDKIDNLNKIDIMANLLKAKLEEKLSIDNFVRLTQSLQIVPFVDLKRLPDYLVSIGTRHDTYMLLAAGLLYNSGIGIDSIDSKNSNHYQLNENGLLFVRYGLNVDISRCVKDSPIASTKDIDNLFSKQVL